MVVYRVALAQLLSTVLVETVYGLAD